MDLILWRHAEAEIALDGMDDLSRELTNKGTRQAARMAAWLDVHLPEGTRVLVSPAKRTEQTAKALDRKYKLRDELVPASSAQEILELIKWHPQSGPESKRPILLVGHQPYLGDVISRILNIPASACPVRKGGVWWLRTRIKNGNPQTYLLTVASPDLI